MTAKIDWYREVLELEPNSKVFFPLARLLAEEGKEDEAMTLLEKGLSRHPEYLEARLFRIELLFKGGRRGECNDEIEKLNRMFASYAGFWQAWAACLASDQSQSDTASLLRFIAAHFVSGPLKLHEVINRGLDAMLSDNGAIAPAPPAEVAESAPVAGEELREEQAAMPVSVEDQDAILEDLDAELAEASGAMTEEAATSADMLEAPAGEFEAALPEPEPGDLPAVEEAAPGEEIAVEFPEQAVMQDQEVLEVQPEEALPQAHEEPELLPVAEDAQPLEEEAQFCAAPEMSQDIAKADLEAVLEEPAQTNPVDMIQAEADMVDGLDLPAMEEGPLPAAEEAESDGEEQQEEQFSLRTRSMAEVLAEQGDIQGALDIYSELADAATSPDEAEDINRRIATLKSRLSMASSSAGFSSANEEAAEKNREKLLGMLEALAQRVEARAQ